MIEPINVVGIKLDLDDDIQNYARKKIGRLDRYIPRHARRSLHAEVRLRDANKDHGNRYECEVLLHLPEELIAVKDSTMNMFAAVDIVEEKLKNRLKKYKEIRQDRRDKAEGILGRVKRRLGSENEEIAET